VLPQFGLILDRTILTAAVGVMGQPLTGSSDPQSLAQRLKRQFLVQPVTHRPANHPPSEEIEDDGQVQPALTRPHVRNIGAPLLVRALSREVLLEQVGRDRKGVMAVGGALEAPLLPGLEAVLAHQPSRSAATHRQALLLQFTGHARTAVGLMGEGEGRADVGQQNQILPLARAG
jgi:hypothetical protein